MQVVIEIPEEVLNSIKTFKGKFICKNGYDLIQGIKNSTPLPKGHGRLGDLDALREEVYSWGMNDYEPLDFIEEIDEAPTIIEADRSKE